MGGHPKPPTPPLFQRPSRERKGAAGSKWPKFKSGLCHSGCVNLVKSGSAFIKCTKYFPERSLEPSPLFPSVESQIVGPILNPKKDASQEHFLCPAPYLSEVKIQTRELDLMTVAQTQNTMGKTAGGRTYKMSDIVCPFVYTLFHLP